MGKKGQYRQVVAPQPTLQAFRRWLQANGFKTADCSASPTRFFKSLMALEWERGSSKIPPAPEPSTYPERLTIPVEAFEWCDKGVRKNYASWAHFVADIASGNWKRRDAA